MANIYKFAAGSFFADTIRRESSTLGPLLNLCIMLHTARRGISYFEPCLTTLLRRRDQECTADTKIVKCTLYEAQPVLGASNNAWTTPCRRREHGFHGVSCMGCACHRDVWCWYGRRSLTEEGLAAAQGGGRVVGGRRHWVFCC